MRGGTSRGPFFLASDLPADIDARDRVLLAVMGSPDKRQIDGLGGAHPLTSKVDIVSRSTTPGVALDFLFAVTAGKGHRRHDAQLRQHAHRGAALCAGARTDRGRRRHHDRALTLNTGMQCDVMVQTPLTPHGRQVAYGGDARIDGVPGSSAPVTINFLDTAGSVCSGLLPTGKVIDEVTVEPTDAAAGFAPFTLQVTCIDNGQGDEMDFTRPYLQIELGYLVGRRSAVTTLAQIDRPGIRVGVTEHSSSGTVSRKHRQGGQRDVDGRADRCLRHQQGNLV